MFRRGRVLCSASNSPRRRFSELRPNGSASVRFPFRRICSVRWALRLSRLFPGGKRNTETGLLLKTNFSMLLFLCNAIIFENAGPAQAPFISSRECRNTGKKEQRALSSLFFSLQHTCSTRENKKGAESPALMPFISKCTNCCFFSVHASSH